MSYSYVICRSPMPIPVPIPVSMSISTLISIPIPLPIPIPISIPICILIPISPILIPMSPNEYKKHNVGQVVRANHLSQ